MCVCVCVCVCVVAVSRETHAIRYTTHIHSQDYSEQRATHSQTHDMLTQHQINITK